MFTLYPISMSKIFSLFIMPFNDVVIYVSFNLLSLRTVSLSQSVKEMIYEYRSLSPAFIPRREIQTERDALQATLQEEESFFCKLNSSSFL